MLVLTVRPQDKIILRDRPTGRVLCEVTLTEVDRGKTRWGFVAGDEIEINRQVVDDAKHVVALPPESKPTRPDGEVERRQRAAALDGAAA